MSPIMLHILRKILTADPEKFYKVEKFTDQQTHTDTDTHKQRERERKKTKDKKLFHLFDPKEKFLRNFTYTIFSSLLSPILQPSLKKFLTADLKIYACIIVGEIRTKITHLAQNKNFSEISLKWFLYIFCALCCTVWKKSLVGILTYKLPSLPQLSRFVLFIVLFHAAKF